jgi:hypothetical protein
MLRKKINSPMKNMPVLLLLFFGVSLVVSAQAPDPMKLKKDVVDYYWEMASADADLVSYPLEMKDKNWTTVSIADYEMPATVNTSRGYVSITDPARDSLDKASTFQFMIFERSKGDPIIAISKKKFVEKFWTTEFDVWEKKGGKWFNVTSELVEELTYQDFLEGKRDGFKYSEDVAKMLPIHYQLPEKGMKIQIFLLNDYFAYYCHQERPDDPNCGIQGAMNFDRAELHWQKGKGNFSIRHFKKSKT